MDNAALSFYSEVIGLIAIGVSLLRFIIAVCRPHLPSNKIKVLDILLHETENIFNDSVEAELLTSEFVQRTRCRLTRLQQESRNLQARVYNATTLRGDLAELLKGTSSDIGRLCHLVRELKTEVICAAGSPGIPSATHLEPVLLPSSPDHIELRVLIHTADESPVTTTGSLPALLPLQSSASLVATATSSVENDDPESFVYDSGPSSVLSPLPGLLSTHSPRFSNPPQYLSYITDQPSHLDLGLSRNDLIASYSTAMDHNTMNGTRSVEETLGSLTSRTPHSFLNETVLRCHWIEDSGEICGAEITSGTLPGHLANKHGIRNKPRSFRLRCEWKECRKREMSRGSIVRHVREVHLGFRRSHLL